MAVRDSNNYSLKLECFHEDVVVEYCEVFVVDDFYSLPEVLRWLETRFFVDKNHFCHSIRLDPKAERRAETKNVDSI